VAGEWWLASANQGEVNIRGRRSSGVHLLEGFDVGLAAVVGDEVLRWASVAGVEQDADGEREEALGDPLDQPCGCFRQVVFESHLAFQVRDCGFDDESDAGEAALVGEVVGVADAVSGVEQDAFELEGVGVGVLLAPESFVGDEDLAAVAEGEFAYGLVLPLVGGYEGVADGEPFAVDQKGEPDAPVPAALGGAIAVGGEAGELALGGAAGVLGGSDQRPVGDPQRPARGEIGEALLGCVVLSPMNCREPRSLRGSRYSGSRVVRRPEQQGVNGAICRVP